MIRTIICRGGKFYSVFTCYTRSGWGTSVSPCERGGKLTGEVIDARTAGNFRSAIDVHLAALENWQPRTGV